MAPAPGPEFPLVVTGSGGRVGRALRAAFSRGDGPGRQVLWLGRRPGLGIDIAWDILREPAPDLPPGAAFLHLAGTTRGTAAQLAENRLVTAAVCHAAQQSAAARLFLMSSAAVYRPTTSLVAETVPPDPQGDYGRAKLAAEQVAAGIIGDRLIVLRLGNLAGADALLGGNPPGGVVTLDPIPGQPGGPERSYIGPQVLTDVLAQLLAQPDLPQVLNLAQPPVVAMADLLDARAQPWRFGPPRPGAIPRLGLSTDRLAALVRLPAATPASLIADLAGLAGLWP